MFDFYVIYQLGFLHSLPSLTFIIPFTALIIRQSHIMSKPLDIILFRSFLTSPIFSLFFITPLCFSLLPSYPNQYLKNFCPYFILFPRCPSFILYIATLQTQLPNKPNLFLKHLSRGLQRSVLFLCYNNPCFHLF